LSNKLKVVLYIIAGAVLVGIGVLASFFLIQRLQAQRAPEVVEEETVLTDVVIVTRALSLGDTLVSADLDSISVPVEIVPRNVITNPEEAVGKIVKTDLVQGEMLLLHNLADPTNRNEDLSFILSEDHVLMAFPADDLMSRESMVQRGDIVDIFASIEEEIEPEEEPGVPAEEPAEEEEEEEPQKRTFTFDTMERVEVTALVLEVIEDETANPTFLGEEAGQEELPKPETNIRAYLLALNPQDALILKHLKDTGAIFDIVLRAPTSTVEFELTPVTEEFIIEFYGLGVLP